MKNKKKVWKATLRTARYPHVGYVVGIRHLFSFSEGVWRAVCGSPVHQYMSLRGGRNKSIGDCQVCKKIEKLAQN
jgi:hypothetical protein